MPTNSVAVLLKNGKRFSIDGTGDQIGHCQYDHGELDTTGIEICGAATEIEKDRLPRTLKEAMPDSIMIMKCPKCGKLYLHWESGDWDILHFWEVTLRERTEDDKDERLENR